MSGGKVLVGAATRYIAGRNAVQTVYWRSKESAPDAKMIKVAKTLQLGKRGNSPPQHVQEATTVRFK